MGILSELGSATFQCPSIHGLGTETINAFNLDNDSITIFFTSGGSLLQTQLPASAVFTIGLTRRARAVILFSESRSLGCDSVSEVSFTDSPMTYRTKSKRWLACGSRSELSRRLCPIDRKPVGALGWYPPSLPLPQNLGEVVSPHITRR